MATQVVELTGDEAKLLQSIQSIINKEDEHRRKLQQTGDAAERVGLDFEDALAKVKKAEEESIGKLLRDLSKMGPEGKAAADKLKQGFADAGKYGVQSFDSVVAALGKIDPAAAAAAKEIKAEFSKLEADIVKPIEKSEAGWQKWGKAAIGQIGAVVGAYVGIQEGIQLVTKYLEDQEAVMKRALDRQLELAKAQQDAAKNLAGLSLVQRDELLQNAVPEIARDVGFADTSAITTALGEVASAGESDSKRIADAVRQAARVERLTPENLGATASTSAALRLQTGLPDIRQAIGLVETSGTQAKITDPKQLAQSLPRAVGSTVATVRGQDREEAARQAAALFSQITQGGNDEKGTSSATFAIDFSTRLQKFFEGIENERIDARSKVELFDRKIEGGTDTEADRRDRRDLLDFLMASEGVKDPGTLFGRIEALQGSDALAAQFKGEGFGEKQFQIALNDLTNANSDLAMNLKKSFDVIQASVPFFEQEAAKLESGTPQLSIATAKQQFLASQAAQETENIEGATLNIIRSQIAQTLEDTRGSFFQGLGEPWAIGSGGLTGGSAAEEAVSGASVLLSRRNELSRGGIDESERPIVERLDADVNAILKLIEANADALSPESIAEAASIARTRRAGFAADVSILGGTPDEAGAMVPVETLDRMIELLERTAAATEDSAVKLSPGTPNYGDIQRGAR